MLCDIEISKDANEFDKSEFVETFVAFFSNMPRITDVMIKEEYDGY